jgi:hypothetical protein
MSLELDELLTTILILKLVGFAFMVAAFVQFIRRGHARRADKALRNFLGGFNRRP